MWLKSFLHQCFKTYPLFFGGYALVLTCCIVLHFALPKDAVFFWVNGHHSEWANAMNTILTWYGQGEFHVFFLCYLLLIPFFRSKIYLYTALTYTVLILVVNWALKNYFLHLRPLSVYGLNKVLLVEGMPRYFHFGFPSGHTSGGFAMFTFLLLLIPIKHKFLEILFLLLACGVAYSRMYLGQHFFEDVIAGSCIGINIGLISVYLTKRYWLHLA